MSYTPETLLQQLNDWNFSVSTLQHKALFTTEERDEAVDALPGAHCKSLFVKNKKSQKFLVVLQNHKRLDINALSKQLGGGRLSFCSSEQLFDHLGVRPGSVSPLALSHKNSAGITVILDHEMMQHDMLNYHPLTNTMTTSISRDDFMSFLEKTGHSPQIMMLP